MEDYSSNSHKSREVTEKQNALPEKKVNAVVTTPARTTKRSGFRRLADIIIAEDAANVKSYIFTDVLVPALKKAISDIFSNGIDMLLYGESGRSKKSSPASRISYRSYYDRNDDRPVASYSRDILDYDIEFDSRGEAEIVLNTLEGLIDHYGVANIGDLYDLSKIPTTNYAVNKYGWTDVSGAQVIRRRDKYVLKMPKAMPID